MDCCETPRFHHCPSVASAQSTGCIYNFEATARRKKKKKKSSKQAVQLRTGPSQNPEPKYFRGLGKKFWNKHLHLGPNSAAALNSAVSPANILGLVPCPGQGSNPVTPGETSTLGCDRVSPVPTEHHIPPTCTLADSLAGRGLGLEFLVSSPQS